MTTSPRICGLALLAVALVLPLLDPHALEGDPYHEHIVVGGSPVDQARALAAHLHHRSVPLRHESSNRVVTGSCASPSTDNVQVVSVHSGSAAGSAVIGFPNTIAAAGHSGAPIPTLTSPVVVPSPLHTLEIILLVPDPPPRGA